MDKYMIVFLSEDKNVRQVITPSKDFNNEWSKLSNAISRGSHYGFLIR